MASSIAETCPEWDAEFEAYEAIPAEKRRAMSLPASWSPEQRAAWKRRTGRRNDRKRKRKQAGYTPPSRRRALLPLPGIRFDFSRADIADYEILRAAQLHVPGNRRNRVRAPASWSVEKRRGYRIWYKRATDKDRYHRGDHVPDPEIQRQASRRHYNKAYRGNSERQLPRQLYVREWRRAFETLRQRAAKKGIAFELTEDEHMDILSGPCEMCGDNDDSRAT